MNLIKLLFLVECFDQVEQSTGQLDIVLQKNQQSTKRFVADVFYCFCQNITEQDYMVNKIKIIKRHKRCHDYKNKTTENIFNNTDLNYMIKMFRSTTFHCN